MAGSTSTLRWTQQKKEKTNRREKGTANKVFYVIKGSKTYRTDTSESQDKIDNAAEAGKGWLKRSL
jgi:predicted nucleic acid-binding Zn ribbon protein